MPAGCLLLERARRDAEFGSHLEFFASYALASQARLDRRADDKVFIEFAAQAKQLARDYPGLETRHLDGGRGWDALHYLLSGERRRGEFNESDWAKRAIRGGEMLESQAQTITGISIRYSSPAEVNMLNQRLQSLSAESLRQHWDVPAMLEAGVYKIHPEDDEESFRWIKMSYEQLADFYELVAENKEYVVTCLG